MEVTDPPLLTAADIKRHAVAQQEADKVIAELQEQLASAQATRASAAEWLSMVVKLIGSEKVFEITGLAEFAPSSSDLGVIRDGRLTFTSFLERYVTKKEDGVDYSELRKAAMDTPLRESLEKTDSSFHGAIAKLVNSGRAFRHNQMLFSPAAYEKHQKLIEAGLIADDSKKRSPMAEAVKRYLERYPNGATSGEIIDFVREIPEFADTINRHRTSAYNVIARLTRSGEIEKTGRRYRLVHFNTNAAVGAAA